MKKILLSFLVAITFMNVSAQIPTGYYDGTTALTGPQLKTKLSAIITNQHQDKGYSGLWTAYKTTDRDYFYENDGTILDIYSENPTGPDPYSYNYGTTQCGTYSNEGDCYNREHVVPQSLFSQAFPMKSDIHFIRPTDGKVNGMRSNYPYGKVAASSFTSLNGSKLGNSASPGYSGIVFEPIDAFKGDIARMIFYFVTRYESKLSSFSTGNMLGGSAFPGLQTWELNQLLAWHISDPVSSEEIARNDASYVFQKNRNPFIDHPEYAEMIWATSISDTEAPTSATNLAITGTTTNSISVNWTAATDNVAVTGYDVYKNSQFYSSVTGTNATISGLSPSTTYNFYIIAKDAAGNSSPQSSTITGTTLNENQPSTETCGSEDFETIPTNNASSYLTRSWTNNTISWTSTDSRTDQTINGKAITIRNGYLSSSNISGGIKSLTVKTQLKFSGKSNSLTVEINGVQVGTIPYSSSAETFTIDNININGDIVIKITNPVSSNRVAIDDLSWTCYGSSLKTANRKKEDLSFRISQNPVKNNELSVEGKNLTRISKVQIYSLSGTLIQTINHPFSTSNKINLRNISKGNYILTTDTLSTKFSIE